MVISWPAKGYVGGVRTVRIPRSFPVRESPKMQFTSTGQKGWTPCSGNFPGFVCSLENVLSTEIVEVSDNNSHSKWFPKNSWSCIIVHDRSWLYNEMVFKIKKKLSPSFCWLFKINTTAKAKGFKWNSRFFFLIPFIAATITRTQFFPCYVDEYYSI